MSRNGFRFVPGKGRHYDVPNRDITADEFAAMTATQKATIRKSPAFQAIPDPPPAPVPAPRTYRAPRTRPAGGDSGETTDGGQP